MPKTTTKFYGFQGLNCNGKGPCTGHYTISGGTQGTVDYRISSLNNGEPIMITRISVVHDAYDSKDSFKFYFVSTEKVTEEGMTTAGGYQSIFKELGVADSTPTVDYFNSLLVDQCWPANTVVTEHCQDISPSSGSLSIDPTAQYILITWMPYAEWLAETTTQAGLIAKYYDGTQWVQVK